MENQERYRQMEQMVSEWQQSGQSQRTFAQQHKINYYTFRYWIEKLVKKQGNDGFIQINNKEATEAAICLRYPNGVELILPRHTSVDTIKGLVKL